MGTEQKRNGLNSIALILLAGIIIIGAAIAIASVMAMPTPAGGTGTDGTRTITDMAGNTVTLPANISRIAITCCGGATHEVMVLAGSDIIVAQPAKCVMPQLRIMQPGFAAVTDAGSFDDVNVEEILTLHPDFVIASVTSEKGNAKIRESGIPVVTVMTGRGNMSLMKREFAMMGEALGRESDADALLAYWDTKLSLVQDRVSQIPPNEKKRVYYMLGKTTHTNGAGWWGQEYITAAGGINVAEDLGTNRDTSLEQVVKWDPDVIIISSNEGTFIPVGDIRNNAQLGSIAAVKNNQLYSCPIGSFWWDRPSPESPLGILWLAKTLYPEQFFDIDMRAETQEFYRAFYHYALTDTEYEAFLITPSQG
jgi:iron complex transport system substrate-binding protein